MKLGARAAAALIAGLLVALITSSESAAAGAFWSAGSRLFGQFGRYLAYPFFFFGMAVAVGKLTRARALRRIAVLSAAMAAVLAFILAFLGAFFAFITPIRRIPVAFEQESALSAFSAVHMLNDIFPHNLFAVFNASSLLPLAVLACILGLNFAFDREAVEPVFNLFDSFSRIFYRIVAFYAKYSAVAIFFFAGSLLFSFKKESGLAAYAPFIWLAALGGFMVCLGVLGFAFYLFSGKKSPFAWLRGMLLSPLFALVSPDFALSGALSSYISHENQGVKRDLGGWLAPFFVLFGRAGTAFVSSMSVVIILKSYSSLDLTLAQFFLAVFFSFICSFLAFSVSTAPVWMVVSLVCSLYGKGIEGGARIIEPILAQLTCLAGIFDAFVLLACLKAVASAEGFEKRKIHQKII